MKRLFAVAIGIAVVFSGVAAASVLRTSRPSKTPSATAERQDERKNEASEVDDESSDAAEDAGIHGGPIERSHTGGSCDLTNFSALPGNWTHGDYVSAGAAGGDPALIQQAAHSDCGKPMVAVGYGAGPPADALANMAAGQAHAGGGADHSEARGDGESSG